VPATWRARSSYRGQWRPGTRVIALITGRADAARIAAALRPLPVRFVSTTGELRAAVDELHPSCAGLILEAHDARGESTSPFIIAMIRAGARIPILGYTSAGPAHADDIRDFAHAGVHELVFREVDDSPALLTAKISRGEEACAAAEVFARIAAHTPVRLRGMIDYVLNYPRQDHSVTSVASALGIHRRTLVNWCERAKVPPPATVITWSRLLLAAELLQVPGRPVERVANSLEFASAAAFRNLCQRYLGRRPSTLREPGALDESYAAYANAMTSALRGGPPQDASVQPFRSVGDL